MGKNHRHKKQLKSEKAKTKLKGSKTKFLPKGQNVTDVSFKVKAIVLPEQLRAGTGSEPLSSRKLNVKEILARLKHHNVLIRVENCVQLRELIVASSDDVLRQNLSQILRGVCPLVLDVEAKVRGEAVKALRSVLSKAAASNVETFFGVLSTYLRCSMTHINRSVQEDSLSLLDVLLEYVPDLVAKNADVILLSNFFTLISRLRGDSKPGRTLTENLCSKHTSVRWRIKVLRRLKGISEAIYLHRLDTTSRRDERVALPICMKNRRYASLCVDKFTACPVDFFSDENVRQTEDPTVGYIKTLMPLLYETWVEVAAAAAASSVLTEDSSETLTCVLDVTYFCWRLAVASDEDNKNSHAKYAFASKVTRRLFDVLLKSFPYSRSKSTSDSKCVRENLLICYVFAILHKRLRQDGNRVPMAENVLNYINYCLCNRNYIDGDNIKLFTSVLKTIYFDNLPYWKSTMDVDELTRNMLRFYRSNTKISKDDSVDLFFMLCEVAADTSDLDVASISLRLLLEPEIRVKTLDYLLVLVKKNAFAIRETLTENIRAILDNIASGIKFVDADDPCLCDIKMLSLYCYAYADVEALETFRTRNVKYDNFVKSIIQNQ